LSVASGVDLATAIDAFLSQPELAPTTRAKYRQTLMVVEDELGDAPVTGACLAGAVEQRWHHASMATWNRHVATVRSFARYCARTRILGIAWTIVADRGADWVLAGVHVDGLAVVTEQERTLRPERA
jgi:hypothetical protein